MWHLESPEKTVKICVWQTAENALRYSVHKNGHPVLREGVLGLCTSLGDFTADLSFRSESRASIREDYSIPAGKKLVYHNNAEELLVSFEKCGATFAVRLRAFDDGAAFRYELDVPGADELQVRCETTSFAMPEGYNELWLQDLVATYEGIYKARTWDKSMQQQPFGMPVLMHSEEDGLWLMLNEANVINTDGSYCSCHLVAEEGRSLCIAFAPEECGQPLRCRLPFCSPWRYAVVADDLNELVNSTVNYNLNPPSVISDTSWIHPARALWAWWETMNGAQLYTESKAYVDLAAAYGFEAVTLDCGWDPSWIRQLCDYAHSKGVQIWVWTGMQRIDTREKAEQLIPLWAGWGIDGLKVDFFENDSQHTMWQYNMIADLMTKHGMMINFHGSVKPMGEGRTWPNFLTAEGILGMEHYQWSNLPDARHNCTVPFTRNVAGPMDYTPTAFSNANRNTTMGHQLALPVVFDSGVTHYALALKYIEGWGGTDFLRRTHASYDGVKVLSGYPGDHAVILRYTKDDWLIGAITNPGKTLHISLDFLPEGEYIAEIYEDTCKGEMIMCRRCTVTRADVLDLVLLEHGGAGVYISKAAGPLPMGVQGGYMSAAYVEYPARCAELHGGSEPVQWIPGTDGCLLNGSATFVVEAAQSKRYTLRVFYAAESPWEMELTCGSFSQNVRMPASGAIRTFVTVDIVLPLNAGSSRLTLRRTGGKSPGIRKIHLIENDPPEALTFPVAHECLTGGGELIEEDGIPTAVGLGGQAELEFRSIHIPRTGRYIVRIWYSAGDCRDISVQANDLAPVRTYLHSTCGWDFPTWKVTEAKEVLLYLEEGENCIRLFNREGGMSHIKGIEVIPDVGGKG